MFEWMHDRIAEVQATPVARKEGWNFVLPPPAGEHEVAQCERELGTSLPPSYRSFLLSYDGASLFRREHRLADGRAMVVAEIGIQGTRDLPAFQSYLRTFWEADDPGGWGSLVVFCRIPGSGADYCALNPERSTPDGEYAVVDCHQDMWPRCWRRAVIAPSFDAWLRRAFDAALRGESPYYWLNLPELRDLYRECREEHQRELAQRRRPG